MSACLKDLRVMIRLPATAAYLLR
jgi:hypothetical protein